MSRAVLMLATAEQIREIGSRALEALSHLRSSEAGGRRWRRSSSQPPRSPRQARWSGWMSRSPKIERARKISPGPGCASSRRLALEVAHNREGKAVGFIWHEARHREQDNLRAW
jgi:hypothetical protein